MKKLLVAMLVALMVFVGIASAETLGSFEVTGGQNGIDYTWENGELTVHDGANITIAMASGVTQSNNGSIIIDPGAGNRATVTLDGVKIITSYQNAKSPIIVKSGNATVKLKGTNTLTVNDGRFSAINVPAGTKLTLGGTDYNASLTITGCDEAASIGGCYGASGDSGTIVFDTYGQINITHSHAVYSGAAVGSGSYQEYGINTAGSVTLNNGRVTIVNNGWGGAIGGHTGGGGCTVTVNGGKLTVSGRGIGCGSSTSNNGALPTPAGNLIVNGGEVDMDDSIPYAYVTVNGGSVYGCSIRDLAVHGGSVTLNPGDDAAGIGGDGDDDNYAYFYIDGGSVRVNAKYGAALGGDRYTEEQIKGTATIRGGTVELRSTNGAAIGQGSSAQSSNQLAVKVNPLAGKQIRVEKGVISGNSTSYDEYATYDSETTIPASEFTKSIHFWRFTTEETVGIHKHAACGDLADDCIHSYSTNLTYAKVNTVDALESYAKNGGSVVLTGDISLANLNIPSGVTLNLCLNGHSLYYSTASAYPILQIQGTLNLCDCTGNGSIDGKNKNQCVQVSSGGVLNLYSGSIKNGQDSEGANVRLYSGAKMTMYGGTISGGTSTIYNTGYGTGVFCEGNSIFTMNGGTITNNHPGYHLDSTGNELGYGGAIAAFTDAEVFINGGSITGNSSYGNGHAIYLYCDRATKTMLTITGGTISDNYGMSNTKTRIVSNSAIYAVNDHASSVDAHIKITGGNITNNDGSALYLSYVRANIQNTRISGNESSDSGGGIYLYHSSATLDNVIIEDNIAKQQGAGIMYVGHVNTNDSWVTTLKLNDCVIRGNYISDSWGHGAGLTYSHSSFGAGNLHLTGKNIIRDNNVYYYYGHEENLMVPGDHALITLPEGTLDAGSSIGITSLRKTDNSTILRFLQRSSGSVTENDLAAFYSDAGYPTDIDSAGYGVLGKLVEIKVITVDAQMGTVSGGNTVASGTSITVKATPTEGYAFVNWTDADGDEVSTDAEYTFTAAADTTLTANFVTIPMVTITVRSSDESLGEASVGTGGVKSITVRAGTEVTASAAKRNTDLVVFNGWYDSSDALLSTSAGYSFTAVQDMDLTAKFSLASNASVIRTHIVPEGAGTATGGGIFLLDSTVSFTATANEGYRFVNWTNVNGSEITASPSFRTSSGSKEIDLYANFRLLGPIYTITATPDNASNGTVSGAGEYEEGESVTVTATPKQGYRFLEWQENGATVEGAGASYTFTVESARTLTAVFGPQQYGTLTINKQMNGATLDADLCYVTLNGQPFTSGTFGYGDTISLTPVFPEDHFECHGFQQQGHEDGYGGSDTFTFTMPEEPNVVMNVYFSPRSFEINVTVEPAEAASATEIGGTGTGLYGADRGVDAYCYEDSGYVFYGWYDSTGTNLLSTNSSYDFVIEGNTDLIAKVVPSGEYVRIEAQASDRDGATVSGSGTYRIGSTATLTVTPKSGYTFVGWEGNSHEEPFSTATSITVDVPDHNMYYTAIIAKDGETHTLNVSAENGSVVNENGVAYPATSEHESSKYVHLLPKPNDGYEFDHWEITEDRHSYDTDREDLALTMTHNWTVKAVFREVTYRLDYEVVNGGEGGSIAVSPNYASGTELDKGTEVTLTATPDTEYEVYEWVIFYGDESFEAATHITDKDSVTVTMTDDVRVTLEFRKPQQGGDEEQLVLRLETDGNGRIISDSGNESTHNPGDEVEMRADPNEGYEFVQWIIERDDGSADEFISDSDYLKITMTANTMVFAEFREKENQGGDNPNPTTAIVETQVEGDGSVTADMDPIEGSLYELPVGEEITLTATPGEGHVFLRWDVETPEYGLTEEYSTATITLAPEKNTIAKAVFIPDDEETLFEFAISTRGSGEVESTHEPGDLPAGTEITLTATPDTGCTFKGWRVINMDTGSETVYNDTTLTIKLTKRTEVLAEFTWAEGTTFDLTFYTYGEGYINTSHQAGAYAPGTEIELTAIPADGWRFSRWVIRAHGGESREDISTTITLEADTEIHVEFLEGDAPIGGEDEELFFFDYGISEGAGTITANYAPEAQLPAGTQVTLKATPAEGYVFSVWVVETPDSSAAPTEIFDNEITITIQENTYAFAFFNRIGGGDEGGDEPELRIFEYHVNGNGSVEISHESGEYEVGTEIMLQAIPGEGASFIKWVIEYPDAGISEEITDAALLITLDENTVVIAEFSDDGGIGGDGPDTPVFEYSVSGNGSVESSHENGNYDFGTDIMLKAIPNEGAAFIKWIVEYPDHDSTEEITDEELLLTLDENTFVIAEFSDDGGIGGDDPDLRIFEYHVIGNGTVESSHESGEYEVGTEISLTANPADGASFIKWVVEYPDLGSSMEFIAASLLIELSENTVVTAEFSAGGGIGGDSDTRAFEYSRSGNGSVVSSHENGNYAVGTEITLQAFPDVGAVFARWLVEFPDAGVSTEYTEESITLVLTENTVVVAQFADDGVSGGVGGDGVAQLFLLTDGNGRIECEYESGEFVPLGTPIPVTAIADEGFVFSHWVMEQSDISGAVASSEQSMEIILTTQTTLTAYFVDASTGVPDCELALATEGSGTLTGTSAGVYPPDTAIMLTAVPEDMWRVCAWLVTDLDTGDSAILETNQTEFTFVLRQNVLITVVFEPGYVIEAKANDEMLGTVTGGGVYYAGEEVTLTATPANEQSLFTGWYAVNADGTINLYSEESELVFSPTSDLTLVAWFTSAEVAQYVINTTAVPEVGGLVTGEGFYDEGATVTLTATANDGYTFIGWYENNTAITTEATLTFTAESNREIEARFDAIEEPSSTVTLPITSVGGTVSGAGEYEIGATVTVTATPEAGFIFNGWYVNGELVSTDPTYTFVVNGDVTLTPGFTDVRTKLLIITHPADAELFAGETAVFSVTASGDGLTYQWQQSSRTLARTVNWINIDGAILPTYQVEATVERDGTQYRCIVTDQYGNTLTSYAATLTVLENPVLPPTGDGFNAALWLAMLAVSTVGVILLRKRVRG